MKGDFSRDNFDPKKHYSAVLMQQGRVQLDADWNEQQAIHQHRIEAATHDLIGASGTPGYQPGFAIIAKLKDIESQDPEKYKELSRRDDLKLANPCDFIIGLGRYYVDGILCENDDFVRYQNQPDLPNADTFSTPGTYLVYLDVWRRHITALDDTDIREKALGGPDTTTRIKTVWQVKVQPSSETWPLKKTTGTLKACCSNFRGLDNQLYRVEVHQSGILKQATFKWSRDNGAIAAGIKSISGKKITVENIGSDDVHGFASGQWVEVISDVIELNSQPVRLLKITEINPENCEITVDQGPGELVGGVEKYHPKLRRWDSPGAITVQIPDDNEGYIKLEDGIEVRFEAGDYNTGDYWLIPARAASNTETGNIEWPADKNGDLIAQPPRGIQHHYCRLALLNLNEGKFTLEEDCRTIFQPPAHLVEDTLGLNPADYQRGRGRPEVSLRAAINALLRGELPSTPKLRLTTATNENVFALEDQFGDLLVFWNSDRIGKSHIWYKRYSRTTGTWSADTQLTTATESNNEYYAQVVVKGLSGDLWVFWTSHRHNVDIWYKRYRYDTWSADTQLTAATDDSFYPIALDDPTTLDLWVFWCSYISGKMNIWYKRYSRRTDTWSADTQLATAAAFVDYRFVVLKDQTGDLWVFWRSFSMHYNIYYKRYSRMTGTWSDDIQLIAKIDHTYIALQDLADDLWVFWVTFTYMNSATYWKIWYKHYSRTTGTWSADTQLTTATSDRNTTLSFDFLEDHSGDIWVFWNSLSTPTEYNIWYKRYNRTTGTWSADTQLTTATDRYGYHHDYSPVALKDQSGDLWVFWNSHRGGIWCKRYSRTTGTWSGDTQLTTATDNTFAYNTVALKDQSGDLWVFFVSKTGNANQPVIWYKKLILVL